VARSAVTRPTPGRRLIASATPRVHKGQTMPLTGNDILLTPAEGMAAESPAAASPVGADGLASAGGTEVAGVRVATGVPAVAGALASLDSGVAGAGRFAETTFDTVPFVPVVAFVTAVFASAVLAALPIPDPVLVLVDFAVADFAVVDFTVGGFFAVVAAGAGGFFAVVALPVAGLAAPASLVASAFFFGFFLLGGFVTVDVVSADASSAALSAAAVIVASVAVSPSVTAAAGPAPINAQRTPGSNRIVAARRRT
jgi:hypothetical protein